MARRRLRSVLLITPLVAFLGACSGGPPPPIPTVATSPDSLANLPADRVHQQARAALVRWGDAAKTSAEHGVIFTGELTGQVGDWEEAVGENNKMALMSGVVHWPAGQAASAPPDGEIRWPDGRSQTVALQSADDALREIVASSVQPCPECRPLDIVGARLTTAVIETATGPATTPVWEFRVAGTAVRVTRVAVAQRVSVVAPPWDPNNAPEGISIESGTWNAGTGQLTVSFIGAPDPGDKPCGEDYTGEAVETDLAIVVIVTEHHALRLPVPCSAVGAERTATVSLAAPLGSRAVLEVKEGLPVPVTPG